MHRSQLSATLVLFLSLLFTNTLVVAAAAASSDDTITAAPAVAIRQTSPSTDPNCIRYAQIANISSVGLNSTIRSIFLQASPAGTLQNRNMLDSAVKEIPSLMFNQALNQECGNLTAIALAGVASNFSQGIVLQFSNTQKFSTKIDGGPIVLFLSCGMMTMFLLIANFIP